MGVGTSAKIRVPLSLVQEFMWLLEEWAPVPGFYNEAFRHRFPFSADPELVAAALTVLVQRHEALRTVFPTASGMPYQSITPARGVEVPVTDLGHLPPEERHAELGRLQSIETDTAFDVTGGPLFRARLFRLGEGHSEVSVVLDHLVADATAEAILASELDEVYASLAAGREPVLDRQEIDYADFAVWQRRWLNDHRRKVHTEDWKRQFTGIASGRRVPYCAAMTRDASAPARSDLTQPPAMYAFSIPPAVGAAIRRIPRSPGFVICSAAVACLVARATGEPDTVLVTSVGGRDRAELEGVVGLFGGPSVLRLDLSGDPVVEVIIRRARASVMGMLEHQHLPLSHLLGALAEDGTDLSLDSIPVAVHFFRAAHRRWVPGTSVVASPPDHDGSVAIGLREASKPLEFRFYDDGTTLWCELFYHPDYYDAPTVALVVADLNAILEALSGKPLLRLSQLT